MRFPPRAGGNACVQKHKSYTILIKVRKNVRLFHMIAGMLSGPKALEGLTLFKTIFNSSMVKFVVGILSWPDISSMCKLRSSGRFAFLPRRFLKWRSQLSFLAFDDLPFIPGEEFDIKAQHINHQYVGKFVSGNDLQIKWTGNRKHHKLSISWMLLKIQ